MTAEETVAAERGIFDLDYFRGNTGFTPAIGETINYFGRRWRVTDVRGCDLYVELVP